MKDLREWMAKVESIGELRTVEKAHWDLELGGIVDVYQEKMGRPALLFDRIPGYPAGYRVLANVLTSMRRIALSLGLSPEIDKLGLLKAWKTFYGNLRLIPPKFVKQGPVRENILKGNEINLLKFPTPKWHEADGGRFIGTGNLVIMKDPDTGWVNVGTYRVQLHDEKTAGLMITRGRHGDIILQKYWAMGKPCPVAVSLGQDPLLLMLGGIQIPFGVCEYDVAGGIRNEPVEVMEGDETGLPIPANAEIVIEGEVPSDGFRDEGPFGEWQGYYASGLRPMPVIKIKAIYHRDAPILLGVVPRKPPNDNTYYINFLGSAAIWEQMERAGIPGIQCVWNHEAGGARMWMTVSIKQMYPGHAKHAGMVAASCGMGGYSNRVVVVVDDDIDPFNSDEVIWAISTRVDVREDVDIIRKFYSGPLDPMAYPRESPMFNARMIIDACRPWERRETFPAVAENSKEFRAKIIEKWSHLFDDIL